MTGQQYEYLYALYLKCRGYPQVEVTPASGDKGVDVIAYKGYKRFAFQCKLHSRPVGYKALEEVLAGAKYRECDNAIVVTNNTFTKEAREASKKLKVILQPNKTIESLVKVCADGYREGKFNSENDLLSHLPVDIQETIISEDRNAIKYINTSINSANKIGMVHNENEIAEMPERAQNILLAKSNDTNLSVRNREQISRESKGMDAGIVTFNIPKYSNAIIKQTANESQSHTAIPLLLIYIGGLIVKMLFDVACIITPYACVFAILFTFLCVNPKWYRVKAYRISNIIIGLFLMCIGGLILIIGMPALNELPDTFAYVKADTYVDMLELQALYYGSTLFISALLFLCVKYKETSSSE